MKKNRNNELINSVFEVLSQHTKPEDAVDLIELCAHAAVRATDAFWAITALIDAGFRIRLTDSFPRKFYYNEQESQE